MQNRRKWVENKTMNENVIIFRLLEIYTNSINYIDVFVE